MAFTLTVAAILSLGAALSILTDNAAAFIGDSVVLSEAGGPTRFDHDMAQFAEASGATGGEHDTALG